MKLKQLAKPLPRQRKTVSLEGVTANDLDLYRKRYKEVYGQDISEQDLLQAMITSFLEDDRDFQRYKLSLA